MDFEQYIHTLIAANSLYTPEPSQVADFMSSLVERHGFNTSSSTTFRPGLRVVKPSGQMRSIKNAFTGEVVQIPGRDIVSLDDPSDFATALNRLEHYDAVGSGEWKSGFEPFELLNTDEMLFREKYYTDVVCSLRQEPVSTSCMDFKVENDLPPFGEASPAANEVGLFTNPWTDQTIEVPDAGRARFWIGFEFGKFLLPRIAASFELMKPSILREAEDCFRTKFVQGWHYY